MFFHIVPINREEVDPAVGGPVKPGEMVDSQNIHMDVVPVNVLFPAHPLTDAFQQLLGSKDLVAAPKRFDLWKGVVKGLYAEGHRVGIVDDPGLRRILPDCLPDFHKHGNRPQRPDHTARPGRIPDRLVDSQPLRQVHVRLHLVKSARKDGYHNKITAVQGLLQALAGLVCPFPHRIFPA